MIKGKPRVEFYFGEFARAMTQFTLQATLEENEEPEDGEPAQLLRVGEYVLDKWPRSIYVEVDFEYDKSDREVVVFARFERDRHAPAGATTTYMTYTRTNSKTKKRKV